MSPAKTNSRVKTIKYDYLHKQRHGPARTCAAIIHIELYLVKS
jgi:hypothetical protein